MDGALTNFVNCVVTDDVTHTVTLCATQAVWKADKQEISYIQCVVADDTLWSHDTL